MRRVHDMNSEYWRRVEDLYHRALEVDPSARAEFLQGACAEDAALRREIESLLACENEAQTFLEDQKLDSSAGKDAGESWLGRQIGSYKILSLVGAGAMGEVYSAQDTRLGRRVGIKVLPSRFL